MVRLEPRFLAETSWIPGFMPVESYPVGLDREGEDRIDLYSQT